MMKLYGVPAAPNPTKVMLYVAERQVRGTDMNIEHVRVNTLKGEQNQPEHLARNVLRATHTGARGRSLHRRIAVDHLASGRSVTR